MLTRIELLDAITGEKARLAIAEKFGVYASPGAVSRCLLRYELMKLILDVHGSIVECGVGSGHGLFSWLSLSKLLEPLNRHRMVIGFDTFTGFPSVSDKDRTEHKVGDQIHEVYGHLCAASMLHAAERVLVSGKSFYSNETGWEPFFKGGNVGLVKGDFMETGEQFLEDNKFFVAACLYLDFDLYEPTKKAIELFVPRMPKGAIIAFDELNHHDWPGETLAVLETLGIRNLRLKRFPWESTVSYAILE